MSKRIIQPMSPLDFHTAFSFSLVPRTGPPPRELLERILGTVELERLEKEREKENGNTN